MPHSIKIGNGQKVVFEDTSNNRQIARFKADRNHRLAESDLYMIEDYPTDKKTEWKAYRQALRDMDFNDLDNLNWPTKPE
mgnify:CR=1 FL=1|tara:strand:+ start:546 stop:785 length:240 start_codon:yes stop_codon:yes gene_type:complete